MHDNKSLVSSIIQASNEENHWTGITVDLLVKNTIAERQHVYIVVFINKIMNNANLVIH